MRIKGHWNFPADCTGTVAEPPAHARELVEDSEPWQGHYRLVRGVKGPIEFVWVNFDKAQNDGDGDGPYSGGEIETEFVSRPLGRSEST